MKKLLVIALMLVGTGICWADGLSRPRVQPRIAAPVQGAVYDVWKGSPYAGLVAGYSSAEDDTFLGGGLLGYSTTNGVYEFGVEVDLSTNPARFNERVVPGKYGKTTKIEDRLEDWQASIRGFGGVFVVPKVLVYGTAGPSWVEGEVGLVWGPGVRYDISDRFAIKGEILRYELEEDATVFRVGGTVKLWN